MSEPIKINIDNFRFTITKDLVKVVVDDRDNGIFHCQHFHAIFLRGISISEKYKVSFVDFTYVNRFDLVFIEKERDHRFSFPEKSLPKVRDLYSAICMNVLNPKE